MSDRPLVEVRLVVVRRDELSVETLRFRRTFITHRRTSAGMGLLNVLLEMIEGFVEGSAEGGVEEGLAEAVEDGVEEAIDEDL